MVAQEQPSAVKVGLSIHESHVDPAVARSVIIGPASLSQHVLEVTGIVECAGKSCEKKYKTSGLSADDDCIQLLETQGGCNVWLFIGNDLSRSLH